MRPPDRFLFLVRRRLGFSVGSPHLLTASLAIEDRIAAALGVREYLDEGLSIDLFHDEPDMGSGFTRHPIALDNEDLVDALASLARGTASSSLLLGVPPAAQPTWVCTWRQTPMVFRFLGADHMSRDPGSPRPRIHVGLDGTWSIESLPIEHKIRVTKPVTGRDLVVASCSCGYNPPAGIDPDDALAIHVALNEARRAATS